jgi:hypothetical protein
MEAKQMKQGNSTVETCRYCDGIRCEEEFGIRLEYNSATDGLRGDFNESINECLMRELSKHFNLPNNGKEKQS